ncbi:MAG: D-alanyl-D-alanine carboxypeptidase [Candidatus Dormibacteraeota bacterium]|nr:D-alanyl-D-alanine carboxypeptidase [Candidatus Dormibacteraeota bacterium]
MERQPRRRWPVPVALSVVALVVVLLLVNEFRPVTAVAATQSLAASTTKGSAADLPWPAGAQAAIGVEGAGVLASSSAAKPLPIASVAKVMTALVTLEAKPLKPGQQGPEINVTADDVNTYQRDNAGGGSVVAVQAGEQLSEFQALEGLLVASGNNIATLLANWAFGSTRAAVDRMNEKATELGLARSHFTDPSGLEPQTVSTPADLVLLGEAAMQQQVIANIVGEEQATLPVAGVIPNVNYHLGTNFIVGIKTGSAPQAGAVYLFAATHQMPDGKIVLIFGAVQNLHTLDMAFAAADNLLAFVRQRLQVQHVVSRNQTVGRIDAPWGSASDLVAGKDLDIDTLSGMVVRSRLQAEVSGAVAAGDQVGSLHVSAGESSYDVPVNAADGISAPGRLWRLTRTG